ncbi:MAG TPA: cell wall hydrolase [Ideonella sp.]|uniref:cell wall hydrolase n=1 Tax=Ideonella sp. TaxID=1929293 RepID=UPI002E358FE8|nr:cell wall hydrolase [Ideonella sp.]HEX5684596.1 cell wall hydrolase [Ideonella sp.]
MSRRIRYTAVHAAFRRWAQALQRRAAGLGASCREAPDWLDPSLVESISLSLPDRNGAPPLLQLGVRNGIPTTAWPKRVRLGAAELVPRVVSVARARAQAVPSILRQRLPQARGTATCLVRDRLNPQRQYLLTCAHVMAPTPSSAGTDTALIGTSGLPITGFLCEWQPGLGRDAYRTPIDAALLEVSADDARALQANEEMLAERLCDDIARGDAITVRRCDGPLPGELKIFWSGWMDVAQTEGTQDYFLDDGIGYRTDQPTLAGDSGAAIWNDRRELLGMHLGEIDGQPGGGANAVFGRIAPVLDWFKVAPYTRSDRDALGAAVPNRQASVRMDTPPAAPGSLAGDAEIVAQTLWGEARGEGEAGMRAVASVIQNRLRRHYRRKTTASQVCLDPFQFSCWNSGDANRHKLDQALRSPDDNFRLAQRIAAELVGGGLADIVDRATHYFASSIRTRPNWARGKTPCKRIGGHEFYNDVD